MSRIGQKPIPVPDGVTVSIEDDVVSVSGKKGEVSQKLTSGISVEQDGDELVVRRAEDNRSMRAQHGLMRSLVANAVHGVAEGFSKRLEINGVGFRAEVRGGDLHLSLGFSHPVVYSVPDGIEVSTEGNRITVSGADRQQVGQVAAEIRALRPPDVYKGKGIRYEDEHVRRKVGKAGAVGGGAPGAV